VTVKTARAKWQVSQLTTLALRRAGWLALIYVALIFLLPANQATMQTYHLSALEYRTILLSTTLPLILAWLVAFAGSARLKEYVNLLKQAPEGACFDKLAIGTGWLAWSLPLTAIVILLFNALSGRWHNFHTASIIISNYVSLVFPLIAFGIIGAGARGLVSRAQLKISLYSSRAIMLLFLAIGVLYCYLIFRHLDLSSLGSSHNPYLLPVWLIVLSIIIPYLYAWFIGLLAAYEIALFSRQADGVLYRQSLRMLAFGLVVIIASSIALQYMTGLQPRIGHLVLGYQMIFSLIFYVLGGLGFVLLAIGAGRLKRIEEV